MGVPSPSTLGGSLWVYVPAVVIHKGIGLGRVLLLAYLLSRVEYGLWALATMLFNLAAALLTLGSNHGLVRYVSFYEAAGQLDAFYRRVRRVVPLIAVVLTAAAVAASGWIAELTFAARPDAQQVPHGVQVEVCLWALGNALLLVLYQNLVGFLVGMRAYRRVSGIEVGFSLLFTAAAVGLAMLLPAGRGATAVLTAHALSLAVALVVGMVLLDRAVRRRGGSRRACLRASHRQADAQASGAVAKVIRFGFVAAVGTLIWNATNYVSLRLVGWSLGQAVAGVFNVFLQLSQPVLFVAGAAWTVLFTHVARRWEDGERRDAMLSLEAAYKGVVLAMGTLAVVLVATAGLWVKILPEPYRDGRAVLPGMLMFFQALNHMTLVTIIAKLRERPAIIGVSALVGAGANAALALLWLPRWGAEGAAWAAGAGMYLAGGGVCALYLLAARIRLKRGTWLSLLLPGVLLLGGWPIALVVTWALVLGAACATGVLFDSAERHRLNGFVRSSWRRLRGSQPRDRAR